MGLCLRYRTSAGQRKERIKICSCRKIVFWFQNLPDVKCKAVYAAEHNIRSFRKIKILQMNPSSGNFFEIPQDLPLNFELFQTVLSDVDISIERIISTGQKTPDDQWLEQDKNEWVILLQGESEISMSDGSERILRKGDYLNIPKNTKHRILRTSSDPPCIWLAVHY